jgi:hypothetical protein
LPLLIHVYLNGDIYIGDPPSQDKIAQAIQDILEQ